MARSTERRSEVVSLDIHQILSVLPQRYPFVMVDRVTEVVAGKYIRGHKCVGYNEPYFPGHFPKRPIMPGVLILESLSQIGGILAYVSEPFDPTTNLMYFLGIDKAKFRRPVRPGDQLIFDLDLVRLKGKICQMNGKAFVRGALVAEAELLSTIVDK